MKPYYEDDQVQLFHGDCLEVMASMGNESVDAIITDPPYTERTHSNARSCVAGIRNGVVAFGFIGHETLSAAMAECARIGRGWVVATMDYRHAVDFESKPPSGLSVRRIGVWMKTAPTPQLSGDRPAQGWEAIAYMHRADRRSRWNGGGLHGNYHLPHDNTGIHPTAKPIGLVQDLVRKFTNRDETIFDPFAGSGTTLRAAVNEGRRAIGVELEERYCEIAARRLDQMCLDFGGAQ